MITSVGGLIGLGAGFGIALVASLIVPDIRVAFTPMPMLMALICAITIGLVFGFTPARNAAVLDPVVALSSE